MNLKCKKLVISIRARLANSSGKIPPTSMLSAFAFEFLERGYRACEYYPSGLRTKTQRAQWLLKNLRA